MAEGSSGVVVSAHAVLNLVAFPSRQINSTRTLTIKKGTTTLSTVSLFGTNDILAVVAFDPSPAAGNNTYTLNCATSEFYDTLGSVVSATMNIEKSYITATGGKR
jgi:hypothetical protein